MWLVRTKYKAGIYISQYEIKKLEKKIRGLSKQKYDTYEEAYQALKDLEKSSDYKIQEADYKPNRLYKLFNDKVYTVFYNSAKVAFFKEGAASVDLIASRYYKKKSKLTYSEAVAMVTMLGAETGKSEILTSKVPVSGRWYQRNSMG